MKFLYTIVFIIIAGLVIYGALIWLNQGGGISLQFNGPKTVLVGEPFDLKIAISNPTNNVFRNAQLSLKLPEGIVFIGREDHEYLFSKDLGNLGSGSSQVESFQLMLVKAKEGDVKNVEAMINYSAGSSTSRFEKKSVFQVTAGGPAVSLTVTAPDQTANGKQLTLKTSYKNTGDKELNGLFLAVDYPQAFTYLQSTLDPDPESKNNKWLLGGLHPQSEGEVTILGKLISQPNSVHSFKFKLGAILGGKEYIINEQIVDITIKSSSLSLEILANNVPEYIAEPGEVINYTINYRYLDQPAKKAVLTAQLKGPMFVENKVLTWNLSDLQPTGSLAFQAAVRPDYPIRRLGDRNFILEVEAKMDDGENVSLASIKSKVKGRLEIDTAGFFRDAASGIVNNGPWPPKAGEATQYTIHWKLVNYANNVRQVVVRAPLPSYVRLVQGADIEYGSSNNEVIWRVKNISATRGVLSKPVETVFQIEAVPPSNSVGDYLPLLGETTVTAIDEFTGFPLENSDEAVTTQLSDDQTIGQTEGIVR